MNRPFPPEQLLDELEAEFVPAPDVLEWALEAFVEPGGPFYDEGHEHLLDAQLGFLWTSAANSRRGVSVAGDASMPQSVARRLGGWEKEMYLWNLRRWFGTDRLDFLIRLSAPISAEYSDLSFCALVKHELCHCAQALKDGRLWFKKDGSRVFTLVGHDVEQHIAVVRDFGPVGRNVKSFVEAATSPPRFGEADVEIACGNCLRLAA
jgi:hypothetical protein